MRRPLFRLGFSLGPFLPQRLCTHLPWQVTMKSTRELSGCGPGIRTSVIWMMLTSRMPSNGTIPHRKTHQNTMKTKPPLNKSDFAMPDLEAIPEFGYMSRLHFQSQTELFFSPSLTFIPGACVHVRRQMTLEEGRPHPLCLLPRGSALERTM